MFRGRAYFKVTGDVFVRNSATGSLDQRVLTLTFLDDDTAVAMPTLTINATGWTDGTNTGTFAYVVTGWCGDSVYIDANHAGTEPTENSDLYIKMWSVDLLGGTGVDQVDNTAERDVYFLNNGLPKPAPFADSWVVTITNNAVLSATGTIRIILFPCK